MTEPAPYNNARFKIKLYDWDLFLGPAAGDVAPDFTVSDLETGEPVSLSSLRGKWVVIETGSSTCSMYTKNIPGMESLCAEHPDVEFLVIYVHEAHPGERLHQHKNFNEKVSAARLLKPRYNENRRVLVDSHAGDFHRVYGMKPNFIYVIRPDGTVHYVATGRMWMDSRKRLGTGTFSINKNTPTWLNCTRRAAWASRFERCGPVG